MASESKTLAVLGQSGAGKTTLMGRLLYIGGGIGFHTYDQLTKAGSSYIHVAPLFEKCGLAKTFYTTSGAVTIIDTSSFRGVDLHPSRE
ncbi:hypothetical protein B0T24DRAFT_680359 [Lasiosphaeria ovina]|uniref:Uncharacterized protein n=1 Tax=Lasiosphaeria ovina TaxID=92902 RepID=A0AAE0K6S9_9PEZI|nr:hypothetical protein B0T24DRAFT_680359 [Lasiosphaeria ovina]